MNNFDIKLYYKKGNTEIPRLQIFPLNSRSFIRTQIYTLVYSEFVFEPSFLTLVFFYLLDDPKMAAGSSLLQRIRSKFKRHSLRSSLFSAMCSRRLCRTRSLRLPTRLRRNFMLEMWEKSTIWNTYSLKKIVLSCSR